MGNRVMEKPNLHGGTVARHHVPKAVRQSRKRARRRNSGIKVSLEPVEKVHLAAAPQVAIKTPKPRRPIERPSRKPAPQIAAKASKPVKPLERPRAKPVPQAAAKAAKPVKPQPIERPKEKPVPQIAAKAAELPKPVELPNPKAAPDATAQVPKPRRLFERFTLRRAPQKPPEVEKPEEPTQPTPPPAQAPVSEKTRRPMPVDTFEDGAIEWGIKREGEDEGSKDPGT